MTDTPDPPFDLSRPEDRADLIASLLTLGIDSILFPGIPWPVVCIPLVTQEEETFYIEAFEETCPALIGVFGRRPDPDPEMGGDSIEAYSTDYYGAYTLSDTVDQVTMLWEAREKLITAFRTGHFDDGGLLEEVLTDLTGTVLTYEEPTEPVAVEDWEAISSPS